LGGHGLGVPVEPAQYVKEKRLTQKDRKDSEGAARGQIGLNREQLSHAKHGKQVLGAGGVGSIYRGAHVEEKKSQRCQGGTSLLPDHIKVGEHAKLKKPAETLLRSVSRTR